MKKFLLAGVALTALLGGSAGSASAADMALKARPLPPVPVFSWTGFYVGGHGGCAQERKDIVQGPFIDADPAEAGTVFALPRANGGGCYGGIQGGYNYQVANWVFGIEADASWGSIKSSTTLQEVEVGPIEVLALYDQNLRSFGTVRGRLGYAWSWGPTPILWYATAGWAWARNELTSQAAETVAGVRPAAVTDTQTHSGYAVGTGIEVALGYNWSLKGEYLYMDLRNKTYATSLITDDGVLPGSTTANVNLKINTVRIGLNYRFGYGGVMAAY